MLYRRQIWLLAGLLALGACTGGYRQTCSDYGFREGTDAFAYCVQRERQATSDGFRDVNDRIYRNMTRQPAGLVPTTICERNGNEIYCTHW